MNNTRLGLSARGVLGRTLTYVHGNIAGGRELIAIAMAMVAGWLPIFVASDFEHVNLDMHSRKTMSWLTQMLQRKPEGPGFVSLQKSELAPVARTMLYASNLHQACGTRPRTISACSAAGLLSAPSSLQGPAASQCCRTGR